MQSSIGKQANLLFLSALMAQKKHRPNKEVMDLLQETVEIHFAKVKVLKI